jgi:molecular chaperone GrpE
MSMNQDKDARIPSEESKSGQGNEGAAEASTPGPTPAGGTEGPVDAAAFQALKGEKDELYERLLRKQAEMENLRKRAQREKEEFLQHATADLIRALLPTLDAFERALDHRNSSVPEDFYQGVELIYREMLEVLRRAGLTPIETVGKTFDPHLHQAIEAVESPDHRDQEILEELQRGYKLKHRLLRPAVVRVAVRSKGAAAPGAGTASDSSGQDSSGNAS